MPVMLNGASNAPGNTRNSTTLATGKATRFPAHLLEVYGGAVIAVKNSEETRA